jgi:hypothetical protein
MPKTSVQLVQNKRLVVVQPAHFYTSQQVYLQKLRITNYLSTVFTQTLSSFTHHLQDAFFSVISSFIPTNHRPYYDYN